MLNGAVYWYPGEPPTNELWWIRKERTEQISH
jgi:hypothetical protein